LAIKKNKILIPAGSNPGIDLVIQITTSDGKERNFFIQCKYYNEQSNFSNLTISNFIYNCSTFCRNLKQLNLEGGENVILFITTKNTNPFSINTIEDIPLKFICLDDFSKIAKPFLNV